MTDRIPPHVWLIASAIFHYLGPAFAVLLFAHIDALGVAWLRIASAALVFALWRRPWRFWPTLPRRLSRRQTSRFRRLSRRQTSRFRRLSRRQTSRFGTARRLVLAWGAVLAVMNSVFYLAIDRLPLGTVAAIEFLPVIALAAVAARTPRNLAALMLAVAGVYFLTDVRLVGEPLGFAFAAANAVLFALYIVLGHRIASSDEVSGIDGLALAMLAAAVAALPIGVADALPAFTHPLLLAAAVGVGICSSVIPYVCDQAAMAKVPRATYALMVALLPATATVIGVVVLAQLPTLVELAGVTLVVAGVALHRTRPPNLPPDESAEVDALGQG